MWRALILFGLGAVVTDGPGDDSDVVAPYLGLTLLDAEDLQLDSQEEARRALPTYSRPHLLPPPESPWWAALLPDLSLALQYRTAWELPLAGASLRLAGGVIFLVEASFPLQETSGFGASLPKKGFRNAASVQRIALEEEPGTRRLALPTVGELQKAAERAALVPLSELQGWRGRIRNSAWLPELSAEYRRNVGEIDTLGIRSDLGIDSRDLEDVSRYGVRVTWQLSKLLFSAEEVSAAQTTLEIQRSRQELLIQVADLYYEWRKLRLRRDLETPAEPRRELELQIDQLAARLDALTGSYFSKRLAQLGETSP